MNTPKEISEQLERMVGESLIEDDLISPELSAEIDKTCEVVNGYFDKLKENTDNDLQALNKSFSIIYGLLYKDLIQVEDSSKLIDEFDDRMLNDKDFKANVVKFVEYRKDAIASDREALAYMLIYKSKE